MANLNRSIKPIICPERTTVKTEYKIFVSGMYVSDKRRIVMSLIKYTHCIFRRVTCEMLIARASSPLSAPPSRTQKPVPTPTKIAPTIEARSGYDAIAGKTGPIASKMAYDTE